jgi:hypothetical protein
MHPLTSRNMGGEEEPQSSLCHVFDFDVEGPAKTNYEGETIFNGFFFNYARQSQRRYNFVNKCRRLCFTSVLVKMPITIEGTVNNTPEARKFQMHGVLLLQIHPLIPSP